MQMVMMIFRTSLEELRSSRFAAILESVNPGKTDRHQATLHKCALGAILQNEDFRASEEPTGPGLLQVTEHLTDLLERTGPRRAG